MRIAIFADGTKHPITRCGAADGVLWIGIPMADINLVDAFALFSDKAKTDKITDTYEDFNGFETVWEGYTELELIRIERDTESIVAALRHTEQEE